MKIGIITYDTPHLKTQQVFLRLLEQDNEIYFFWKKFKKFKKRRFLHEHRPYQHIGPDIFELSKKYKIKTIKLENIKKFSDIKYFLICGSGIMDKKYILKNKFINCHSGLIPMVRGLDSFKWSILNNKELGNTLHFIDEKIDEGKIIHHKKTPIFMNDDFQLLAKRHYDIEIDMLVNFKKYLKQKSIFTLNFEKLNMRMPIDLERKMFKNFKKYVGLFVKLK